ncbi:MAG TPA: cytochrome c oxidase subunit II [Phycisphaerae bacterium]|nr:cytochrome c oxidase subunit II [Phycisphaerae bacterium]
MMLRLLADSSGFALLPEKASTGAYRVDHIYFALLGLTLFFVLLIGAMTLGFGIKYRAGAVRFRDQPIHKTLPYEMIFVGAPLLLTLAIFIWGAQIFVEANVPPADARTIYVVGKQWMWKIRHTSGQPEINELHVPTGEPIRLLLTSQDVIHSFYVPAFRMKTDALPYRYTSLWFQAVNPGEYHLFCAEYCGSDHARMRGRIVVMKPSDFQRWLETTPASIGDDSAPRAAKESVADEGARNFSRLGCANCHQAHVISAGPALAGIFGKSVPLINGTTALADENYLRESILQPNAAVRIGWKSPSAMPSYFGQVDEQQLASLIEYIKAQRRRGT